MHLSEEEYRALLRRNRELQTPEVIDEAVERIPVVSPTITIESDLEAKFMRLWQYLQGPELEREVRFHPVRRHRLDFYQRQANVAIEVEGGTWRKDRQSRHSSPQGYRNDCEKYNLATMAGIPVLRLTTDMVNVDYLQTIIEFVVGRLPATPPPSSQASPGEATAP